MGTFHARPNRDAADDGDVMHDDEPQMAGKARRRFALDPEPCSFIGPSHAPFLRKMPKSDADIYASSLGWMV
jgi:hypothetical protein